MSQIKGRNTKPELIVRKFLFIQGFRYRLYDEKLPGKPDIIFPKYKKVVLIHGCFWHGHKDCKYFALPKTRTEWWSNKIQQNMIRDVKTLDSLHRIGWKVICIWECELKSKKRIDTLNSLIKELVQII